MNGKTDRREVAARLSASAGGGGSTADGVLTSPRSGVEQDVLAAWTHALGLTADQVAAVDVLTTDFFQLGGNSLVSVRLVERLRRIGHRLALGNVFVGRTVAGMAVAIAREQLATESARGLVVPVVRKDDAATAVVVFDGTAGTGSLVSGLALKVGAAMPSSSVLLVRYCDGDEVAMDGDDLADLAYRVEAELTSYGRVGLHLVGFSFGALVAVQLASHGRLKIASLSILDAPPPASLPLPAPRVQFMQTIEFACDLAMRFGAAGLDREALERAMAAAPDLDGAWAVLADAVTVALTSELAGVARDHLWAVFASEARTSGVLRRLGRLEPPQLDETVDVSLVTTRGASIAASWAAFLGRAASRVRVLDLAGTAHLAVPSHDAVASFVAGAGANANK